jgi:hypothetical protein
MKDTVLVACICLALITALIVAGFLLPGPPRGANDMKAPSLCEQLRQQPNPIQRCHPDPNYEPRTVEA